MSMIEEYVKRCMGSRASYQSVPKQSLGTRLKGFRRCARSRLENTSRILRLMYFERFADV